MVCSMRKGGVDSSGVKEKETEWDEADLVLCDCGVGVRGGTEESKSMIHKGPSTDS